MRVTTRKNIERIRISYDTTNNEDHSKALRYCWDRGFVIMRNGPRAVRSLGKYHDKKGLIIAEREITNAD